jgi:acetoin utilization deacetylase AcuC-like enzyme
MPGKSYLQQVNRYIKDNDYFRNRDLGPSPHPEDILPFPELIKFSGKNYYIVFEDIRHLVSDAEYMRVCRKFYHSKFEKVNPWTRLVLFDAPIPFYRSQTLVTSAGKLLAECKAGVPNPLCMAAQLGQVDVLEALLKAADEANPKLEYLSLALNTGKHPYQRMVPLLNLCLTTCLHQPRRCLIMTRMVVERLNKSDDLGCIQDYRGRNPLHYAALFGASEVAQYWVTLAPQLRYQADDLNMYPVHYAVDSQCIGTLVAAAGNKFDKVLNNGSELPDNLINRCIMQGNMAAFLALRRVGLSKKHGTKMTKMIHPGGFWFQRSLDEELPRGKTLVVSHYLSCLGHLPLPCDYDDPESRKKALETNENGSRLDVLLGPHGVLTGLVDSRPLPEPQEAEVAERSFLPEQTARFLSSAQQADGSLLYWGDCPPARLEDVYRVHDWSYIQGLLKTVQSLGTEQGYIDGDTAVTAGSLEAALSAAGAVIVGVDAVMSGVFRNAFCAVRPPGHHVASAGPTNTEMLNQNHQNDSKTSNGFCLLNNVDIGAAYAKATYKEIRKIAIFDFDLHHGNGTQMIVKDLGGTRQTLRVEVSGETSHFLTFVQGKPWQSMDDQDEVFFASVHRSNIYPSTGYKRFDCERPVCLNASIEDGPNSEYWRKIVAEQLLEPMLEFKPDLIMISAGFDAHEQDMFFAHPRNHLGINELDFEWVTQELMWIAQMSGHSRVCSVLEGGYTTEFQQFSPFAQSVLSHVRTLHHTPMFKPGDCRPELPLEIDSPRHSPRSSRSPRSPRSPPAPVESQPPAPVESQQPAPVESQPPAPVESHNLEDQS